jgi:hypothetical protein
MQAQQLLLLAPMATLLQVSEYMYVCMYVVVIYFESFQHISKQGFLSLMNFHNLTNVIGENFGQISFFNVI